MHEASNNVQSVTSRWIMVFVMVYVTIVAYFVSMSIPPILPLLIKEFELTYAQGGLLVTAGVIPCIFLPLFGGMLADKYGMKLLGSVSLLPAILGSLIMALTQSYLVALVGRFVIGIGTAIIPVITFSIIASSFRPEEIGKAIGIRSTSTPIALTASFLVLSSIGIAYGWRTCFYLTTTLGIISLILFWAVTQREERPSVSRPKSSSKNLNFRQVLLNVELWKLGIVWFLAFIALSTILVWGPTIFVKFKGIDLVHASLVSMLLVVMHIPASPLFGWISDRWKVRKIIFMIGLLVMAVTYPFILLADGLGSMFLALIIGIASSPIPVLVYVITPEVVDKKVMSTSYGFILTLLNISQAVAPPLIGYVNDLTQSLQATVMVSVISSIAALIVALTYKIK